MMTHLEEPSVASGSRTPRPITLSPSPPRSRAGSMTRTMEPDSMVLLRTIDFAARVSVVYPLCFDLKLVRAIEKEEELIVETFMSKT